MRVTEPLAACWVSISRLPYESLCLLSTPGDPMLQVLMRVSDNEDADDDKFVAEGGGTEPRGSGKTGVFVSLAQL